MRYSSNKNAFTILEIIVVLVVIGILIGIAIPRIKGMKDSANLNKATSEINSIAVALESYKSFTPTHLYPPAVTAINNVESTYLVHATPNIIAKPIYDPFAAANTEYNYMTSSNGLYYVIWSVGLPGQVAPASIDDQGDVYYP